jgi:hypothetical protein
MHDPFLLKAMSETDSPSAFDLSDRMHFTSFFLRSKTTISPESVPRAIVPLHLFDWDDAFLFLLGVVLLVLVSPTDVHHEIQVYLLQGRESQISTRTLEGNRNENNIYDRTYDLAR